MRLQVGGAKWIDCGGSVCYCFVSCLAFCLDLLLELLLSSHL